MVSRICPLAILLILAGCSNKPATPGPGAGGAKPATSEGQSQPAATGSSLGYPALYTSANLPQYANAKLTNTGRQTTSLRDGLALKLETDDDVQTVVTFFEGEMKKLGWTVPEPRFRSDQMGGTHCTKGDLYFQVTVTKEPNGTKITINYAQK